MDSLTGQFLIASPAIHDPNFRRTVVFVTAHTDEGAIGLILNRRSDATVRDAVPPSSRQAARGPARPPAGAVRARAGPRVAGPSTRWARAGVYPVPFPPR